MLLLIYFFVCVASFSQFYNITMLKCQIVFYLLHYYKLVLFLLLQFTVWVSIYVSCLLCFL